ncbi:GumC domain-containing protein [Hymenobacter jejuensis]|uniref:Polysaccharide chain length determinant N-terminal domain-containing protein n=1 Tax=Hymenobacter jejuensis TaxID=2502781 RepID=A0A5B7ZW97_9BACT|nr:hypothetical protein [Hymenobacter jejuensis]QDA58796.1 hypothetical protein FHG12_01175 [Hymenobacter jejuensis]
MSARSYSLLGLWPLLRKWRRPVLGALLLAIIGSVLVALLLPNIYKSTAVFYPTNPETIDPDRLVEERSNGNLVPSLTPGGRAEDLDRIITIGQSQPIAELIIKRFHLHEHYKLGQPGDELADQYVLDEFSSNLSIVHNERDAIELTFQDKDKVLAAQVVNAMTQAIDSFNQQLTLENRRKIIDLYRERANFLEHEHSQIRDSLIRFRRRYGIYGMQMESRYLAKEIVETETALRQAEGEVAAGGGSAAKVAGLRRALRGLTQADGGNALNLENFTAGNDELTTLAIRFQDVQGRLVRARGAYETARLAISGKISSIYVVQKAYPAARKSKPIRWLIVVGSVVVTFVLAVVFIALLEAYRRNASSELAATYPD